MDIENAPLIIGFNNWGKELPPQHRSKAYKFAESFLYVGAMHGVFTEVHGAITSLSKTPGTAKNIPEKSGGDQQEKFGAYLRAKAEENKV